MKRCPWCNNKAVVKIALWDILLNVRKTDISTT